MSVCWPGHPSLGNLRWRWRALACLLILGVALVVPLVFAAAGRVGAHPARSIAGVAGVAYASFLAAPGVIGGIAAASSLTVSFCLVAGLLAVMVLAAGVLRRSDG